MKKILILCLIMILGYTLTAGASRMKVGISDYSPLLKEFSTKHGIYRFNGRFDLLNLSSRLGLGAAMNISFKSDNKDLDYVNNYDLYAHNFFGNESSDGSYMVYGILMGMRLNVVKVQNENYFDKVIYTNWSFLIGALISRNDWGTEIMLSQSQDDKWKFDFTTKYQLSSRYYMELGYCGVGPVDEVQEEFSLTLGREFFSN
ncbi:MAG: hypothetical protein RAO94_06830 [Candidatus Stygibacter australis]|nr:hypothetical protein [Candidatus Stygibacter australis]MDP8322046.1 hypothetical protein [Candidatus Stygibacter australis]